MAASGKLATLLQQYGKVGIGVHVLTSTAYFGCLFVGVRNGVDVPAVLSSLGFESLSARAESAEGWSDLAFAYAGSFSPFPSLVCRLRRAARPSNPLTLSVARRMSVRQTAGTRSSRQSDGPRQSS